MKMTDLTMKNIPETILAHITRQFWERKGWGIYPEVVLHGFNGRADLAIKKNSTCGIIECKTSLSWPLVEQLVKWQKNYDRTNPAIPHLIIASVGWSSKMHNDFKCQLLREHRIGLYEIRCSPRVSRKAQHDTWDEHGYYYVVDDQMYHWTIEETIPPKIQYGSRSIKNSILDQLNPDMNIATAGAKSGATTYMTPFRRTVNRVIKLMSDQKEWHIDVILRELAQHGWHHYVSDSSAKSALSGVLVKMNLVTKTREYGPWFKLNQEQADQYLIIEK